MSLHSARIWLLGVWLAGSTLLMVLAIAPSFTSKYGTDWQDRLIGMSWCAPFVVPTVLMMLAIIPLSPRPEHFEPLKSRALFIYALLTSIVYFTFLAAVPVSDLYTNVKIQDLFRLSALLFVPIQTFVVVLVGKFFLAGA